MIGSQRLPDSFGGKSEDIPAKTEKLYKWNGPDAQNSFRFPPASRAIRALTGSFTLDIRIMAAMM